MPAPRQNCDGIRAVADASEVSYYDCVRRIYILQKQTRNVSFPFFLICVLYRRVLYTRALTYHAYRVFRDGGRRRGSKRNQD